MHREADNHFDQRVRTEELGSMERQNDSRSTIRSILNVEVFNGKFDGLLASQWLLVDSQILCSCGSLTQSMCLFLFVWFFFTTKQIEILHESCLQKFPRVAVVLPACPEKVHNAGDEAAWLTDPVPVET